MLVLFLNYPSDDTFTQFLRDAINEAYTAFGKGKKSKVKSQVSDGTKPKVPVNPFKAPAATPAGDGMNDYATSSKAEVSIIFVFMCFSLPEQKQEETCQPSHWML